jgi:hypothetical protein
MDTRQYGIEITGVSPLLMHQDNLTWNEQIAKWVQDPNNKKLSVAGDDRTPAWRWMGYLYTDAGFVCMPSDNLMTMFREGGAKCPTGKKGGSYKRQTQSGIVVNEAAWPLVSNIGTIPTQEINGLVGNNDFAEQEKMAAGLGFSLFVKRAKIGMAKHVRVRPRFDTWSCAGSITVFDETLTTDVLQMIVAHAGAYAGLCDWRPSSPKSPGPWGKFTAKVTEL